MLKIGQNNDVWLIGLRLVTAS